MGKGDQWTSWIHLDDIVGIPCIDNEGASGPLYPNPVLALEFARTFSGVLKKPYTPWRFGRSRTVCSRLALGEVATVVTTRQGYRRQPLALGYQFKYP